MVKDDCRPVVTLLLRGENRKLATWEPVASIRMRRGSARVKGFGCRPVVTYPAVLGAGVRKPPRKEPAGSWCAVCRRWGFDGAACWVGDALAGVVGGGSTITVASLSPRQRSPR